MCHRARMEFRGQLWGVGSLLSTWSPLSLVTSAFYTLNYLANAPPSFITQIHLLLFKI